MVVGRRAWQCAIVVALAYSAWHFVYSGVIEAVARPNLRDIGRELVPLQAYVASDAAWQPWHNRQYGPVFMFTMAPLLTVWQNDPVWLASVLYGIQLAAFAAAFLLTVLSLRLYLDERAQAGVGRTLGNQTLVLVLIVLWLNFSPAYYLMATKNVETWELCLLSAGLYASLRRSDLATGACVGAAALIKMLPFAFLGMLLLRNRRAAVYAMATVLAILSLAHVVFGPAAGLRYLPQVVSAAAGGSGYGNTQYALTWHENVAVKGMVTKAFGTLDSPYLPQDPGFPRLYYVGVSPADQRLAASVGTTLQVMGGAFFLFALWRAGSASAAPIRTEIWCWALTAAFMLILPPQSAFHYMILALPAVSFVVVSAIVETERLKVRVVLAGGAVLLVANLAPRTVINRVLPLDALREWSGYTHLTLSETYQYFGFPLAGMLLLIAYLWTVRPDRSHEPAA